MDLKENTCLSASIEIGWKRQKSVINCQPEYGIHLWQSEPQRSYKHGSYKKKKVYTGYLQRRRGTVFAVPYCPNMAASSR